MQLDDAFAQMQHIPNGDSFPPRWAAQAQAFRTAMHDRLQPSTRYGGSPRQVYDLFRCEAVAAGTLVFVHGGYWLRNDRNSWSHFAAGALAQGWDVAIVEYDLCPQVRIDQITCQIAQAVTHLAAAHPGPISLTGHSAGGQLVGRMLAPGVLEYEVLARIKAVAPIAPVADLRPLLQTSMNDDLGLDLAAAEAESLVLQPAPDTPVKIWVGTEERPVLLEQAAGLARAWDVAQVIVPDMHHFDIIDGLKAPQSDIVQFLTSQ